MNTLKNFKSIPKRLLSVVLALMLVASSLFVGISAFADVDSNGLGRDSTSVGNLHYFYNNKNDAAHKDLFCIDMRKSSAGTREKSSKASQNYFNGLTDSEKEHVLAAIAINRENADWRASKSYHRYFTVQYYIWKQIHGVDLMKSQLSTSWSTLHSWVTEKPDGWSKSYIATFEDLVEDKITGRETAIKTRAAINKLGTVGDIYVVPADLQTT